MHMTWHNNVTNDIMPLFYKMIKPFINCMISIADLKQWKPISAGKSYKINSFCFFYGFADWHEGKIIKIKRAFVMLLPQCPLPNLQRLLGDIARKGKVPGYTQLWRDIRRNLFKAMCDGQGLCVSEDLRRRQNDFLLRMNFFKNNKKH